MLELSDNAPYKDIKTKTIAIQNELGVKPVDGAFGKDTLNAWKDSPKYGKGDATVITTATVAPAVI